MTLSNISHSTSAVRVLVAGLLLIHTTVSGVFATVQSQLQSPLTALGFTEGEYVVIGFRFPDGSIHKIDGCGEVLRDAAMGNIASIGSANCFGASPLHMAAAEAPLAINPLIKAGAPIEAKMIRGMTPLHLAVAVGELGSAELLLEAGADATTTNDAGATVLHTLYSDKCGLCKLKERRELARLLVSKGAAVNSTDNYGSMPLHYAALGHDAKNAIEELASLGADIAVKDRNGTPLWFYASIQDEKVAEYVRTLASDKIGDTNDDGKDRDEWVRDQKVSIDDVSGDFTMSPVVRRASAVPDASGLRPLEDYYRPMHPEDMTTAEKIICRTAGAAVCHGACRFLKLVGLYVTCMGLCTGGAEEACAYLIHGDFFSCPIVVVIDEDGVHYLVTVPCPM